MSDKEDQPKRKRRQFPSNIRGTDRHQPNTYMPETVIYPGDENGETITGVTREESEEGFSASFDPPFPYEEGDIVDVRVGYQRSWAKIVWTMKIMDKKILAGFKLHPSLSGGG